ncbi:MAG: hypothetical protein ABL999_02000 [Pyrinomonadaceae bacterium]
MNFIVGILIVLISVFAASAQADVQKIVDTEHGFAKFAEENGTKAAFLEFITSDGLLFLPDKVNGKEYWSGRGPSTGLLSWAPNYADISANGILGYTTGNWEYRPKGKGDEPTGFGEFITVWLRQPDGKYKFVVDIGVGHKKPEKYSTDWVTAADKRKDLNEKNSSAGDNANGFFTAMTEKGIGKAYEMYAVDDVRAFREEMAPIIGKKALISLVKGEKTTYSIAKRSSFFGSADLAYNTNTYTKTADGKIVERGNLMQIWKLVNGRWRIVLDIFKPVPLPKK